MKVITFATVKGGVGKTTLSYNYAEYLAYKGNKVLLMDVDSQTALTHYFNIFDGEGTITSIYTNQMQNNSNNQQELKIHHVDTNIDLIAGDLGITELEKQINTMSNQDYFFLFWLSDNYAKLNATYDYLIIDCPPIWTVSTKNAVVISDMIIAPVTPADIAYDSITMVKLNLDELKKETIDPRTKETMTNAKLYYVANMLENNTEESQRLQKNIKKINDDNGLTWIASFPKRELVKRTFKYKMPLWKMEYIGSKSKDELTDKQKNNDDFLKAWHYISNQSNSIYDAFDKGFNQITDVVKEINND